MPISDSNWEDDIAAVRVDARSAMNEAAGVAVVIPAGEIIEIEHEVEAFCWRHAGSDVEWKGITHALFLDDLLHRAKKRSQ